MFFLNAQGRSIGELKPKHKWDKVVNQGMKQNAELYLVFLIEFV